MNGSTVIHVGNCTEKLKELPNGSIHTCCTSPPYWGLRDYQTGTWVGGNTDCEHAIPRSSGTSTLGSSKGIGNMKAAARRESSCPVPYKKICGKCGAIREDDQLGLEETPEEYVENMVQVFREVKRVLRDDGTLWLNLGDSYATNGVYIKSWSERHPEKRHLHTENSDRYGGDKKGFRGGEYSIKAKDLVGIPWRVAFALQADGWYLRQDIIWHKPNPMPESVTDRCTKAHEYIFLLTKSKKYHYDNEAIKEPSSNLGKTKIRFGGNKYGDSDDPKHATKSGNTYTDSGSKNKRSVWTVTTKPYKGAHFATFPTDLIKPCILAGCPKGGTVLDPFTGAGTTGLVSKRLGCNFIGIELNPEYAEIARERIKQEQAGLFTESNKL